MDWAHGLAGLLVGTLVGMTGVGGGSLMAPILVLLLGVAPATAVGTDLWFAAITKSVGGAVHQRLGEPDWQVVKRLALGSLPASLLTLGFLTTLDIAQVRQGFFMNALGVILIVSAIANFAWRWMPPLILTEPRGETHRLAAWQPALTVLAGAVLGILVTLTSIGAGALGAVLLLALYPIRMTATRLVGTDIVHAVPLTIVAGLGHFYLGNIDFPLLGSLLIGSIPGIILGSFFSTRLPDRHVRAVLAVVLFASGIKMLS